MSIERRSKWVIICDRCGLTQSDPEQPAGGWPMFYESRFEAFVGRRTAGGWPMFYESRFEAFVGRRKLGWGTSKSADVSLCPACLAAEVAS